MNKNPFLNAVIAAAYIILIVTVIDNAMSLGGTEETLLMPIVMISLFTLSAAVMGYLFLYGPVQLYLEGDKKGAVNLFLKTVFVFAIITILFLVLLLSGIFI